MLAYSTYRNQWTSSGDKKLVVDASKVNVNVDVLLALVLVLVLVLTVDINVGVSVGGAIVAVIAVIVDG